MKRATKEHCMTPIQFQRRIGDALRNEREMLSKVLVATDRAQMSQERFADRLAMHRTYYSAIERGEKNLTLKTLKRICDELQVKVSTIVELAE